jgi:hypothetical protein
MLMRVYIFTILLVFTASLGLGATRDGASKARAIPLKQRNPAKAVEEEMQWMMKLHHFTPLLAMRDALADAIRKAKAGNTSVHVSPGWEHASVDHKGHLISEWTFVTPRGKRDVYFDTGTLTDTQGEVARQESARAQYMGGVAPTLKVQ